MFVDIKPGTPIIPMAAELSDGKVVLFYDKLTSALAGPNVALPPSYPTDGNGQEVWEYWKWFADNPQSSIVAMQVLEEVIGNEGRPRWMAYRVPLGRQDQAEGSLHLLLRGRQAYDTGDFAYNFVHRGRTQGIRLIGSLRQGPSLNVLAVYEK